jgi:hypothetical protein
MIGIASSRVVLLYWRRIDWNEKSSIADPSTSLTAKNVSILLTSCPADTLAAMASRRGQLGKSERTPTGHTPSLGKEVQCTIYIVKPDIRVWYNMFKIAQGGQAMVGREGRDGGYVREHLRPARELVVEIDVCVGNDADGEVDASDGFGNFVVGGGVVDVGGVDGTQVTTIEKQEETEQQGSKPGSAMY